MNCFAFIYGFGLGLGLYCGIASGNSGCPHSALPDSLSLSRLHRARVFASKFLANLLCFTPMYVGGYLHLVLSYLLIARLLKGIYYEFDVEHSAP